MGAAELVVCGRKKEELGFLPLVPQSKIGVEGWGVVENPFMLLGIPFPPQIVSLISSLSMSRNDLPTSLGWDEVES